MASSHRLATKTALMLQDLDNEDLIERTKCSGCRRLRQLCTATGVMPRFRHRVDSTDQLLDLHACRLRCRPSRRGAMSCWKESSLGRSNGWRSTGRSSLATVAGRPFSAATDAFVRLARWRDWTTDLAAIVASKPQGPGGYLPDPSGSGNQGSHRRARHSRLAKRESSPE